jgi:hypothetical protein
MSSGDMDAQGWTRERQKTFLRELAATLTDEALRAELPSTWDGHELRAWFAQLACRSTSGLIPVDPVIRGRQRGAAGAAARVRAFMRDSWSLRG